MISTKLFRRITIFFSLAVLLLLAIAFLYPPSTKAQNDLECDGVFVTGIFDDVNIESGNNCVLRGDVRVEGDVNADEAGDVTLEDEVVVEGDVNFDKSGDLTLTGDVPSNLTVSLSRLRNDLNVSLSGSIAVGNGRPGNFFR